MSDERKLSYLIESVKGNPMFTYVISSFTTRNASKRTYDILRDQIINVIKNPINQQMGEVYAANRIDIAHKEVDKKADTGQKQCKIHGNVGHTTDECKIIIDFVSKWKDANPPKSKKYNK